MKRKIKFTKDFATRKKDEVIECDSMLASNLINRDKVAKYLRKKVVKDEPDR